MPAGGGRLAVAVRAFAPIAALSVIAGLQIMPALAEVTPDELRDQVRQIVRQDGFGDQLQALSGFAALPGISAATFTVEQGDAPDSRIDRLILPLAHQFTALRLFGGSLHLETTLGYTRVEQSVRADAGGVADTKIDRDLTSLSALGGVGLDFEPLENTILRPIALLGYARLEDDSDYEGPGAAALASIADGIFLNVNAHELLYGGAIEVEHARDLAADLRLKASARYNHLWATTLHASDAALKGDSNFGVFTAAAALDGPLPVGAFGRELRWLGFVTNSSFPGLSGETLGFDYFFEFGGGLEIVDRGVVRGIDGISLRASYLTGDNVSGFSVGAHIEF